MQIDRDKVTPGILVEMREILKIGGVKNSDDLTDEQVIQNIEHLFDVMVEFGRKIHDLFEPVVTAMVKFHPFTQQEIAEMWRHDPEAVIRMSQSR